ncbi:MAG: hypothetical protein Q7R57_02980, partial [Dehalococcoidales bacterium]|nr:hypothetical protein [Dehalococcoidales bacterium]
MKWNFLVVAVLILTMLLGCSSKPPATLPPTQEAPTPAEPSVTPVLPSTEPPKPTPTPTPTPKP